MIRSLRLMALSVALSLSGAACWVEVPDLESTGGGYPPDLATTSSMEPGHEPSTVSETGSGATTEIPVSETSPGAERDSS